jgi:hypothetical protein
MHTGYRVLAALGVFFIAGCAGYSPTVATDEKPTAKDAYLYGRFQIFAPTLLLGEYQTMGFVFKCADEKTYTVRFDMKDMVQVVKIAPSTCSLTEFVYSNPHGLETGRKPVPDSLKRDVAFEAGKAYYLGDHQAEATQINSGLKITRTWRLRSTRANYARTTEQLKAAYPNLSALPTEDRMIGRREQSSP